MERDRKAVAIHDGVVSRMEQVERRKMDSKDKVRLGVISLYYSISGLCRELPIILFSIHTLTDCPCS